jgi:hypothetical protein
VGSAAFTERTRALAAGREAGRLALPALRERLVAGVR